MNTKTYYSLIILLLTLFASAFVMASEQTLYERIGGEDKARAIVSDIWDNHSKNPIVKDRFANSNPAYVKELVFQIFAAATGAPDVKYSGKDMKSAHAGMNISEMEFNAVVDDVLAACKSNGVAQQEQNEVLAILWSVRKDIVNSHIITDTLVQSDTEAPAATSEPAPKSNATKKEDPRDCLTSHEC